MSWEHQLAKLLKLICVIGFKSNCACGNLCYRLLVIPTKGNFNRILPIRKGKKNLLIISFGIMVFLVFVLATEDPPCIGGRCTLNLGRINALSIVQCGSLDKGASSGVVHVTWPRFKAMRSIANRPRVDFY
ncbi:hypothetical protein TNCV_934631 [Trichonephila clavipes]|nr:hypothetical protein TNCV_934631 [Trichonephila clavipes]